MDINEKKNRIDQFLKDLYASVKFDNVSLNHDNLYYYLISRDVPIEDRGYILNERESSNPKFKNFFGKWISRFENVENIDVFCSTTWKNFCQFSNGNIDSNCIKMYIPLDYNHLYEGANKLFDFLARNNIRHKSKIGRFIRFDDIVVRVDCKEDALKIQKFIDSDSYFKEGFIKCNPFAFDNNGCSYAFDGKISYNGCLTELIYRYIKEMVNNSKFNIDEVNYNSFYHFVNSISNNLDYIKGLCDYSKNIVCCENAYFVVNLIKLAITSNDMRDYYKYIEICKNDKIRNKVTSAFSRGDGYLDFDSLVDVNDNNKDKVELFNELILTTMKKYPKGYDPGYPNYSGLNYLNSFLNGNFKAVTRDNDLRNRVHNNLKPDDVYAIVNDSGVVGENSQQQLYNYIKIVMLNDVISKMKVRFPNCYINNIERFIRTNDKKYITNSIGNVRKLVITMDSAVIRKLFSDLYVKDIYEYMERYYVDIDDTKKKKM